MIFCINDFYTIKTILGVQIMKNRFFLTIILATVCQYHNFNAMTLDTERLFQNLAIRDVIKNFSSTLSPDQESELINELRPMLTIFKRLNPRENFREGYVSILDRAISSGNLNLVKLLNANGAYFGKYHKDQDLSPALLLHPNILNWILQEKESEISLNSKSFDFKSLFSEAFIDNNKPSLVPLFLKKPYILTKIRELSDFVPLLLGKKKIYELIALILADPSLNVTRDNSLAKKILHQLNNMPTLIQHVNDAEKINLWGLWFKENNINPFQIFKPDIELIINTLLNIDKLQDLQKQALKYILKNYQFFTPIEIETLKIMRLSNPLMEALLPISETVGSDEK